MSINVDIFEHDRAAHYYVVLQHDEVWELNHHEEPSPGAICRKVGNLWPKGEIGLIGKPFGRQLRVGEVASTAMTKVMTLISNRITHA